MAELNLKLQLLESTSYDGTLIWKIDNYHRRKQDAVIGKTPSLYSPPFYTRYLLVLFSGHSEAEHENPPDHVTGRPGGVLSIFVRRGCAVFRVSFSPIFSRIGYQTKASFLEQVVKTCQKRKFCYNGLSFSQIFVFLSILFTDFS